MFHRLGARLIFSHILPPLVIIPILGLALIYVLNRQFLLPGLSRELVDEARLVAQMTSGQAQIWDDPSAANQFVARVGEDLTARIMLIAEDGRLVASSDANDRERLALVLDIPGLNQAQSGEPVARTNFSQRMGVEVVDVFMPVKDNQQHIIGIVRLSYRYNTVIEEFLRMRSWILSILALALLGGVALGSWIALTINRPLQRMAGAVYDLARGNRRDELPVEGPDEIRQVLRAVNFWMQSLRTLEQDRQYMLANLVHEVARPLGALRTALQALIRGSKNDPQVLDELLVGMDDEAERLRQVVDDLSHLYERGLERPELNRQTVIVKEWLTRLASTWREVAAEKGLAWQLQVPSDLPVLDIDALRLGQALGNLISNAIKYTPSGGEISVTAGRVGDELWIAVGDTGPGIALNEQKKIFLPFYRHEEDHNTPESKGLG